jgi:hypothetical protein
LGVLRTALEERKRRALGELDSSAYKFRLYLNRCQQQALDAMLETHRRLHNLAFRERRDVCEAEGRSVSYGEQSGRFKETRRKREDLEDRQAEIEDHPLFGTLP